MGPSYDDAVCGGHAGELGEWANVSVSLSQAYAEEGIAIQCVCVYVCVLHTSSATTRRFSLALEFSCRALELGSSAFSVCVWFLALALFD